MLEGGNVLIAAGNSGDATLVPRVEALLGDASPLVRAMAVWALSRLLDDTAFEGLMAATTETDPNVLAEWASVSA